MMENRGNGWREIDLVRWCMFLICTGSSIVYAGFYLVSTELVIREHKARIFLNQMLHLPPSAHKTLSFVAVIVLIMAVNLYYRSFVQTGKTPLWYLTVVIDLLLSLAIVWVLQFNYNGILLWPFALVLTEFNTSRYIYPTIVIAVLVYMVTYPGVATVKLGAWKMQSYLMAYSSETGLYINVLFNLINIISIVFFLLVCVMMIVNKQKQLDQINRLARELAEANQQLSASNQKLEELMTENAHMAEIRERNRIAREVHDTIGHTLTGLSFGLEACRVLADHGNEALDRQLEVLGKIAKQGIKDVRISVGKLKPDSIEGKDTVEAIRELVENTRNATRIQIALTIDLPDTMQFDEEEEHTIYRTVQESMTNSIQHGHATEIEIVMKKDMDGVSIHIRDNGEGCGTLKEGFGLRHMRERIQMLHGSMHYDGTNGFLVEARIPLRNQRV